MGDWSAFLPVFLAATVEWVEAFTIVLAVSLSIGWGAASGAAAAALVSLAAMTAVTGGALRLGLDITWFQGVIGVFLLLFGVRWLAKAIARQAGLKALHDEEAEFAETQALLRQSDRRGAWLIAFKGVMLEGLEVWLIVVALSVKGNGISFVASAAALAALAVVAVAGLLVQAPLRRVPENAIKFLVGSMIVSFGTFWTLEALGGPRIWPAADWSLVGLMLFYVLAGQMIAFGLRTRARKEIAR